MQFAPGSHLGPYQILGPLGAGGMGEVYRARDSRLHREVAIKVLPEEFTRDGDRLRRFEQEARAASALNHPNILTVHDVGTQEGVPFLVMELLEGESLRSALDRGALPVRKAVELGSQIARGLAAAHDREIVHRDLKPANIFVTADGRAKILDFGLAKLIPSSPTQVGAMSTEIGGTETGAVLGTVGYMSPEQVRGQKVDQLSDIFSFGCLLYEMLAGGRAFGRASASDTLAAILRDDPAELPAGLPPALARIVHHCLEKDPKARFHSAHDIAFDLEAIGAETAATHTRGASLPAAPGAFRRRLLVAAVVTLAALAALLLGLQLRRSAAPTPEMATSIAVLPFADMSPNRDQEYFADGLSEELLGLLAKIPQLRVVGRTSSFAFKGKNEDLRTIGQKLNVSTVLEGSVRKSGDRLRVTAQLVNVGDGFHLWSETYDRQLTDVFIVQDEIAGAVVEALKVKLLPGEHPESAPHRTAKPEAYNQYLLGLHFSSRGDRDDDRRAIDAFERAIAIDPTFAAAYAGLGFALINEADYAGSAAEMEQGRRRAQEAVERALSLDPELAPGYRARGSLRRMVSWDWAGAQRDFQRALALDPGDSINHRALGFLLGNLGRLPEAIAAVEKATELDPLSPQAWRLLGELLAGAGQLPAARQAFQRALEVSPQEQRSLYFLGVLSLLEGKPHDALTDFERTTDEIYRFTGTAMARHDLGQQAESQQALEALSAKYAHSAAWQIAEIHAWRREPDLAFAWLDRAYTQRDTGMPLLKMNAVLGQLRDDPRYVALLRKMNLPD